MDQHELEQLITEHLGVKVGREWDAEKKDFIGYEFQQNQNTWAQDFPDKYPDVYDSDPYGQDTYVEFRPEDFAKGSEEPIDYGLNERYVWALYQKDVLPKDHTLVVRVWW